MPSKFRANSSGTNIFSAETDAVERDGATARSARAPMIDEDDARDRPAARRTAPVWVFGLVGGGGVLAAAVGCVWIWSAIAAAGGLPWWGWASLLFVTSFLIGIVSVLAGVGGGVLFVPIVGGFFPFHLDFVRGAGLLVALASGLASSPGLLRTGMASLRLALPLGLVASTSAIFGAVIGVALPTHLVQIALGLAILGIVTLQWRATKSEFPEVSEADPLAMALRLNGIYIDIAARRKRIEWKVHHTREGLVLFAGIGFVAGMFGLGAGWANVPALNLVMGAPLKVAVATSMLLSTIVGASAAWVYLNQGAVIAVVTVPSILGVMLGAFIGVRLLHVLPAKMVRRVVIVILVTAGLRALLKGLGV